MAAHMGRTHAPTEGAAPSVWAAGWTVAAGCLMVFGGGMAIIEGISALSRDSVFVTTPSYSYSWSLTGWGWVHLIMGIVVLLAGLALFTGAMWARAVGVVLAGFSMLANFMWLPFAPVWSITLMIVDGFVIWALCAPRRTAVPE